MDYSLSPLNNQTISGINYPVLRYAEVLLLNAEVLNEINGGPTAEAYNAINQVRARAHVADLTPGLSQADFRDSVFLERRKEFIQEGQRWFDLVQTGWIGIGRRFAKISGQAGRQSERQSLSHTVDRNSVEPAVNAESGMVDK